MAMLNADDARIVSTSAEGLAKMTTAEVGLVAPLGYMYAFAGRASGRSWVVSTNSSAISSAAVRPLDGPNLTPPTRNRVY